MELTKADFEAGKVFMKNNDNHTEIQYHFQPEKSSEYVGWLMTKLPDENQWHIFAHVIDFNDTYLKFDIDIFYDYWEEIIVELDNFKLVA